MVYVTNATYAALQAVADDVGRELTAQLAKWGVQERIPAYWGLLLAEEVGEAARAALELDPPNRLNDGDAPHGYYHELIQVAAVAIAAAENYRRDAP